MLAEYKISQINLNNLYKNGLNWDADFADFNLAEVEKYAVVKIV